MRRAIVAMFVVAAAAAPAVADGPSGSTEADNQVQCGDGILVPPYYFVYAGPNGAEVCAENDQVGALFEFRIIVDAEKGFVAVDGDDDNQYGKGWARIDGAGVRCGDLEHGSSDSTAPSAEDSVEDCAEVG